MKQPDKGILIAGKYRLVELLARGGMGSVWVAEHIGLEAQVAIKFITSAASPQACSRFEREAKAAARIQSPHVVHVHDNGVDEGLPYIVMELLNGEDLAKRLLRQQRLSPEQMLDLLTPIAKALRKTHDEGIVHRDLKPGNIFIVRDDEGDDLVKIVDFGIAKGTGPFLVNDDETRTGDVMGSPNYMSPEQVNGAKDIDSRSDLWSLGVIMYRALTGRLPFVPEGGLPSQLLKICAASVPPASSIAPDLPPGIDAFFERALARDRQNRFQGISELKEAFERVVQPSRAPGRARVSHLGSSAPPSRPITAGEGTPPMAATDGAARGNAGAAEGESPPDPAQGESTITNPSTMDARVLAPGRRSRSVPLSAFALMLALAGSAVLVPRVLRHRETPKEIAASAPSSPPAGAAPNAPSQLGTADAPPAPPRSPTAAPVEQGAPTAPVQKQRKPPRVLPAFTTSTPNPLSSATSAAAAPPKEKDPYGMDLDADE